MPAALVAEFENLPFGGFAGELAAPTPPGPVLPGAMRLEIPPADWEAEAELRVVAEHDDGQPQASAIEQMMSQAVANGELEEPPPVPVPALAPEPLRPPEFEPPDWEAERRERGNAA